MMVLPLPSANENLTQLSHRAAAARAGEDQVGGLQYGGGGGGRQRRLQRRRLVGHALLPGQAQLAATRGDDRVDFAGDDDGLDAGGSQSGQSQSNGAIGGDAFG